MEVIMNYPLTTTTILEYGNNVYHHKKNSNLFTRWNDKSIFLVICINDVKLANALTSKLGITNGDMVTFAWNHAPHVELYYGISGIGAICHYKYQINNDQTEYIINNSEDKVIFVDATLVPLLEKIAPCLKL
jgi:fatty-acyl-CoA synthase